MHEVISQWCMKSRSYKKKSNPESPAVQLDDSTQQKSQGKHASPEIRHSKVSNKIPYTVL